MAKTTPKIIVARAQHVLVTPRKANLLLEAIVGRRASFVLKQLAVSPDSLIIDSAYDTKGRTLKRAHIGGRGRTKPYERTAAHLTLNLRVEEAKSVPEAKVVKTKKNTK